MSCSLRTSALKLFNLAILLTLLPHLVFADEYTFSGKTFEFSQNLFKGVQLISSNCKTSCQAKSAINQLKNFYFGRMPAQDVRNPGVQICDKVLNAETVVGYSSNREQRSFCKFKDGSMIDSYSLIQFAYKNSRIKN